MFTGAHQTGLRRTGIISYPPTVAHRGPQRAYAAGHTRHGHVRVADREAVTSAGICRPGGVLGVVDGEVAPIGADLTATAVEVVRRLVSGGGETVTLVAGACAPEGLLRGVRGHLGRARPDLEIVVYEGGQGGYPLLVGVE